MHSPAFVHYLIILGFIFVSFAATSQEIAVFNITQQQGLPSNTVYDVYQSSDGFMWIATENGVVRYNGTSFRRFDNNKVRSRAVGGLQEDAMGRIWLHNFFGEILYLTGDKLQKLESWEKFYSEGFPSITHLPDTLIVNTNRHAYYYCLQSDRWIKLDSLFARSHQQPSLLFGNNTIDSNGEKWFCYSVDGQTYLASLKNPGLRRPVANKAKPINAVTVRLIRLKSSLLLFDSPTGTLLELKDGNMQDVSGKYPDILPQTRSIANLGDSLLAFIGTNGAWIAKENGERVHYLSGKNISGITTDKEGGIWFGTLNEGVFYSPSLQTIHYPRSEFTSFTRLASAGDILVAGSYDGGIKLFKDKRLLASIPAQSNKEVQCLFADLDENRLLLFTDKLYQYNLTTRKLLRSDKVVAVKKIIRFQNDYLLATSDGVMALNAATQQTTSLFPEQRIATLAFDTAKNQLWIGAQKGLYIRNHRTGLVSQWRTDDGFSPGVSSILVSHNTVFLGTLTDGIYQVVDGKLVTRFSTANGMPSDHITALALYGNRLLAGTDKGIAVVDLATGEKSTIDRARGLLASESYDIVVHHNSIWVAHAEGLQQFNALPVRNLQQGRLQVASLSTNGRMIPVKPVVELDPTSQQLSVRFDVSNNLRSQGSTIIRYRIPEIEGNQWHETDLANPEANFVALPAGSFTLEAVALNEDGVPSANKVVLPLKVLAPFWKQSWFLILTITGIVLAITSLLLLRSRRAHARKQLALIHQNQEQQLRIARLTSIRAQMNPHFIFNTLSSIQGKILHGQTREATDSLQAFAKLLRKTLELSSRELVTLQEEIEVLDKYLLIERDRMGGELEFSIRTSPELPTNEIRIPSLITQPYVENAIRHGLLHKQGKKTLTVEFSIVDGLLKIQIDDNGIGRQAAQAISQQRKEHKPFAMNASQQRIDILNSLMKEPIQVHIRDKHNEGGLAAGTEIIILLPQINGTH